MQKVLNEGTAAGRASRPALFREAWIKIIETVRMGIVLSVSTFRQRARFELARGDLASDGA